MCYTRFASAGWADPGNKLQPKRQAGIFPGNGDTGSKTGKMVACVLYAFCAILKGVYIHWQKN